MILAMGANRWQKMVISIKHGIAMRADTVEANLIFNNVKCNITIGNIT